MSSNMPKRNCVLFIAKAVSSVAFIDFVVNVVENVASAASAEFPRVQREPKLN